MTKKKIYYRQCTMRRKNRGEYVAWIPEKFAEVGRWLELKMKDGRWQNHWQVIYVGSSKREESYLVAHERDYLNQRKASDI